MLFFVLYADWGSWSNPQVDIHLAPHLASIWTFILFQVSYIQEAVERDAELKVSKLHAWNETDLERKRKLS